MKMKTFLLGSAAVIGFSGASQAADLFVPVAEPVDYVRICDAFGDGYWYIPGTDTCLAIGGYVRWQAEWADPDFQQGGQSEVTATVFDDDGEPDGFVVLQSFEPSHDTSWKMKTRAVLTVEARSQTDWGPLVSFIEFESNFSDANKSPSVATEDAFISLGPFAAGRFQSGFDYGGGYTGAYGLDDGWASGTAITDTKTLQAQLSWAFNGFGIQLSAEDPSYRSTLNSGSEWYSNSNQGSAPDLVAALTGEWGNISGKVAFLWTDSDPNTTWGVQGGVEISDLFGALSILLAASYIDNGGGGGAFGPGEVWSALGSVNWDLTDNLAINGTARYDDFTDVGNPERWAFAAGLDWEPVQDFRVRLGYRYYENGADGTDNDDEQNALIEFRRVFGP
jgi:hypothetical protein